MEQRGHLVAYSRAMPGYPTMFVHRATPPSATIALAVALLVVALLAVGCSESATPPLAPVGIAKHIGKLLDDPTALPSQVAAPAATTPTVAAAAPSDDPDQPPTADEGDDPAAAADDAAPPAPEAADPGDQQPPAAAAKAPTPAKPDVPAARPTVAKPTVAKPTVAKPTARPVAPPRKPAPRAARRTPARAPIRSAAKPRAEPKPAAVLPPAAAPPPGLDATDLYHRGASMLRQGRYKDAIAALTQAQKLRPSPRTLTLLGQAYFDAHQLKQAEQVLRKAGNHAPAMLMLGTLYQQRGQTVNARMTYKRFLERFPKHAKANWVRTILKAL